MYSGILFKNLSRLNVIYVSRAFKGFQAMRTSRFMAKIVSGSKKKTKWYPQEPKTTHLNIFTNPKGGKTASRRQVILNHVFMIHIVELMSTGQYASEIENEGISITKVKVHPDFKGVNVYWYKKSGLATEDTEKFLAKIAAYLTQQLCSIQVIGKVPPVTFVKDKTLHYETEIENLLKVADYPEDYEPLHLGDTIKSDLGYDDVFRKHPNEEEDPLPEMKQTVFGLNHSKIMNRIQNEIAKRIAAHKDKDFIPPPMKLKVEDAVEFNKKDYAVYLRKRKEARAAADETCKNRFEDYEYEEKWEEESEGEEEDYYEYDYEDKDEEER